MTKIVLFQLIHNLGLNSPMCLFKGTLAIPLKMMLQKPYWLPDLIHGTGSSINLGNLPL